MEVLCVFFQHLHSFSCEFTFQVTRQHCNARHSSSYTVTTGFLLIILTTDACFVPVWFNRYCILTFLDCIIR